MLIPHLHPGSKERRPFLVDEAHVAVGQAVTLHNNPEAWRWACPLPGGAARGRSFDLRRGAGAGAGIGIQNFPEGAAVSLPLRQEGMSLKRGSSWAACRASWEPVFGILTVLVSAFIAPYMPWMLSLRPAR
jgi:ZIP family zinc transporter